MVLLDGRVYQICRNGRVNCHHEDGVLTPFCSRLLSITP